MRALGASRTSLVPGGALAGGWTRDPLWKTARAVPSLDLRFADNKTLGDAYAGGNPVTFTRASAGTFVGSDGLLRTAAVDAPRFDHAPITGEEYLYTEDGFILLYEDDTFIAVDSIASGESLGLLVEEARTNSIRNNTMVGAVAGTPGTLPTNWTFAAGTTGIGSEVVGTGIEGGVNYIDIRYSGTAASSSSCSQRLETASSVAALTGQSWAVSAWIKIQAGSLNGISAINHQYLENNNIGSFVTSGVVSITVSSAWARQQTSRTLSGGATVAYISAGIAITVNSGAAIDLTLRIGLPQLEQGAFATSVIPTTTATATRAADVASITGAAFSSFYNQAEGTMYGEGVFSSISTNNFLACVDDATSANRWGIWKASANAQVNFISSGSSLAQTLGSVSSQSSVKLVGSASIGFVGGSVNGATPLARTDNTNMPVVTQFNIGRRASGAGDYMNGTIKRLTYWPTILSALQQITQP
jgi:hypothetical protein